MRPRCTRGVRGVRSWCCALLLAALLLARGAALAPPSCPPAHADRCERTVDFQKYTFTVNGSELTITEGQDCLTLNAPKGVKLDWLPSFERKVKVSCVEIAPADITSETSSYATVLRALNIFLPKRLILHRGTLSSEHLDGLSMLDTLQIHYVNFEPNASVLNSLTGLRALHVENTILKVPDLDLLPPNLERLQLVNTAIGTVPAAPFVHLYKLIALLVSDSNALQLDAAGGLQKLTINSDEGVTVSLSLPDNLENVIITGWAPPEPRAWEACAKLRHLELIDAVAIVLPADWLAKCTALDTLTVTDATNLARLDNSALSGAKDLTRVSLTGCALDTLPDGLLDNAHKLRKLDLSNNKLLTLPGGLFGHTQDLSELWLSSNQLNNSALDSLEAPGLLPVLQNLRLNDNEALNLCPTESNAYFNTLHGWSKLKNLRNLVKLDLSFTDTSRVCEDWRQAMPRLQNLNLKYTPVTRLTRTDLEFNASGSVTVDLTDSNVTTLEFKRNDEKRMEEIGSVVHMTLSKPLRCDCKLYWAAVALRHSGTWLRVDGAHCADGRALNKVLLDELLCTAPRSAHCPSGCACGVRDDDAAPGRVLQLACAGAGLRRVPSANEMLTTLSVKDGYALDLRLANNHIEVLNPDDLPPNLTNLDLRNNSKALIVGETVVKLASRADRRVWLAGTPLECSCQALNAVRLSPEVFADATNVTCASGASLMAAVIEPPSECANVPGNSTSRIVVVAAALAMVAAVVSALAMVLLRPELRLRAKVALRAWGLLPRAHEANDGRVYDAFVSFAHTDEAVVRELVERLESGATPLRLCVHYRDWAPGGWIPTQIAASVRVSRRTVAVVSAAFLHSKWARAEFREAYAAALQDAEPRLVVVLLEDPSRLPLDTELRAYLAANTYVRWGDPWFWSKLRHALPAPRRAKRIALSTSVAAQSNVLGPSTATASTDTSIWCAATGSTDMSTRSVAMRSTDDWISRDTGIASIDALVQSSVVGSTDTSVPSTATSSTEASTLSAAPASPVIASTTV